MNTQVIFLLFITAAVQASLPYGGSSVSSRNQDGHGNYAFSYDIEDPLGATNGRHEEGDAYGNKRGYYTITDIDGRSRRVDYIADEHGFRAVVQTNEPGTASSSPADAEIVSTKTHHPDTHAVIERPPVVHEVPIVRPPPPPPPPTTYVPPLPVSNAVPLVYNTPVLQPPRPVLQPIVHEVSVPGPTIYGARLSHATRLRPVLTNVYRETPEIQVVQAVAPPPPPPFVSTHSTRLVPYIGRNLSPISPVPVYPVQPSHHSRIFYRSPITSHAAATRLIASPSPLIRVPVSRVSHHAYLPVRSHLA